MCLNDINILEHKELQPSNKLLNRIYTEDNTIISFAKSNQKFYLLNEFDLQGVKLLVILSLYDIFDINLGERVINRQIHVMDSQDFSYYTSNDEEPKYKNTVKYMQEAGLLYYTIN
jgi:hypothetical protein